MEQLKKMNWEEYKHKANASKLWDDRLPDFLQYLYCKQHKYFKAWVWTLEYWLRKNYEENDYNALMKKAKVLFRA